MPDLSLKNLWEIYRAARELPDDQRRAFVESASPDPERGREILALLEADGTGLSAPLKTGIAGSRAGQRFGRYVTGELIGRGGMGEVYSARDTELDRTVALKFLSVTGLGPGAMAERFVREAKAASALNHPNIVTIHEVIRAEHDLAIAMELVEGKPLRQLLVAGPLPVNQVLRIGRQIAEALAAAHANGIIHRDIKPENIMIRPDGYAKVLDFGLARNLEAQTLGSSIAGLPIGTLRYMSPEQARCETLGSATDVFSLGLVLWEAATGRHPFATGSPFDTVHEILTQPAETPSKYNSLVPRALDNLLLELLRKNPAERPGCKDVAERLMRSETHAPFPARHWRGAALALAAVVICAVVWLLLWRRPGQPSVPPTAASLEIVPLTSYEGSETDPTFSPDGRQIAFSWERDGRSNIYIKLIGDGDPLALTKGARLDVYPAWSPDGLLVAFLRWPPGGGKLDLMVVPALGGAERKVAEVDDPQGYPHPIAWMADSKSLAVRDVHAEGSAIFRVSLDTGERQLIAPRSPYGAYLPLPSPDGRFLAFERIMGSDRARLCLVAIVGGAAPERCFDETPELHGAAWTPDSRKLIYANRLGLFSHLTTEGDAIKIADGRFDGLAAAPGGRMLAFTRRYSDLNIWRAGVNGGPSEKLVASSVEDSEPDYSPDGSKIVFRSKRSGSFELFVASNDGSNLQQITSLGGPSGSARWSPDGKQIAFGAYPPGTRTAIIHLVSPTGGPLRRLTSGAESSIVPSWSRDGRFIYFSHETKSLWKIPATGGPATLVSNQETLDATESHDGQSLYFRKSRTIPGIWRMPAAGGGAAVLLPGTESVMSRYWHPTADGISFVDNAGAQPVLKLFDYRTGRIRQLRQLPAKRLVVGPRGMAVSPDGRSILYTREDLTLGDIMLVKDFPN